MYVLLTALIRNEAVALIGLIHVPLRESGTSTSLANKHRVNLWLRLVKHMCTFPFAIKYSSVHSREVHINLWRRTFPFPYLVHPLHPHHPDPMPAVATSSLLEPEGAKQKREGRARGTGRYIEENSIWFLDCRVVVSRQSG